MKTKMSATSSGDVAPSQTSVVTTSTAQSSVWSLCDISTDSHVDLRDITPSISPVFTDDQVHALTRNPNEVDVLGEHFLPHDALKRIDEALRSQGGTNLLYSITNSGPSAAPYNDNGTALDNSMKHNDEELLHTGLHFPETMFSQFDTMGDETDKIINKHDGSLQPVSVSLNWKKDSQSTETVGSQSGLESAPGNPGESNLPKGLRRSPRKLAQFKKDAEGSKTAVAASRPVSRGKDISKLKYTNAKKEDLAKKEVRRSGRVQKKVEKNDSTEDKNAFEGKTSTKKKTTQETEEEKKSSSEEQDVAAKNVRRSPRNMSKMQDEEKHIKPSRKKQEKLVETGKDNKRQNKSLVINKEADCEETCNIEKKPAKSEIEGKTEKDAKENINLKAERQQEEKEERRKSGRVTRKTKNEKTSEDEDVSKDVKTRKKKEDNVATKKAEKTCKADKVDEEDLVKNKKELSIDISTKGTSLDDVPSNNPKKNELQNRQQGKNSSEDAGRIKIRKKDQTKTKEAEDGVKKEENQAYDLVGDKKQKDNLQQNSSKTTEMAAKHTPVEKKESNTGGNRLKESEEAKQDGKADQNEIKSVVLNETDVKSSGVEKVVNATHIERPGNDSAEQKEVTTDLTLQDNKKEASDVEDSSDNEEELEEFNEDSDYDPEYDPDRLWCVCRKPHGNRFMICCDQCEEWFHGACVGVTMSQGRQMEKKGQEYICPKCKVKLEEESKKEPVPHKPEETPPSTPEKAKQPKASKRNHSPKLKMPDNKDETRRHKHSSHRESSKTNLQNERKSKDCEKIFIKVQSKEERKRKVHEPTGFKIPKKVRTTPTPASYVTHPTQRKCISGCSMFAHRGSLYCSQECIARHVEESVKMLSDERKKRLGAKATGTPSKSVSSPTSSLIGPAPWDPNPVPASSEPTLKQGIAVIERSTGRVIAGVAAPSQEELVYWLQDHPMFEVLRPSGSFVKDDKNEKKKEGSEKTIRENIKKSLKEILITRSKEQQDLSVCEEEFQKCANSVEQEMYSFFGDTGHRYKNKYRSLMFNLKDPRNKVLFRHVLSGEISVERLVRMTPEQLASPELATWREQEVKHTLEMIKLNQEEINATKAHIKKTHKGEVEIDDDDLSNLENSVKIKAEQNAEKDLPDSNTSSTTLLLDTTDEHRIHLFDLNCRICTGKMAPPGEPPRRETPAPLVSTTSIIQAVAESSIPSPTPMDVTSANSPDSASVSQPPLSPSALSKAAKKVPAVWKGFVMMQSVAKFGTNAYQVSGPCDDLLQLLPDTLHIQGRIAHEQVWDYLVQLKSSTSREVCVIRYEASSNEEKMSYLSLYSYFYSRNRCGVVSNCYTGVKDMYLVPLASHQRVPPELMPFDGPGLDEPRPHMLLGVIVRAKALFKRPRALSQRSLSPPAKRRASSGSLETSGSEGVSVESPVKKRDAPVELHDSPPADIDDIVFQYHSSQAVKNASKEKSGSPAKASTPSDISTLSAPSSSGPVVSTEATPLLSLEAQKQHLLDLQERARQYILAQTQRKVTDSEAANEQTTETSGASKGEQHATVSDDNAPYDPEEGLDLDLDDPSSKPEVVVSDSGPRIPAVVVTSSQEPTKPSGIQMLVSTLKKLQGAAAKSLAPQLSALTSVLSSQGSSATAANQQDQSGKSAISSTPSLQLTTSASQETRLPVFGRPHPSAQSASSSAVSPGSCPTEMVSTSRQVNSPSSSGPGSGSSVSSSEAWRPSAATGCGPYSRPAQSASSILGQQSSMSSGREQQSVPLTGPVAKSAAPVHLAPQSTVFTSRGPQSSCRALAPGPPLTTPADPQSKVFPGRGAHSSDSTGRGPLSVASAGIVVPRVSTSDGSCTGVPGMQSTSVSTGSGTHSAVSARPAFQSTATTNQGQQSAVPSGRVLHSESADSRTNRWNPSEPPQVVRQVEQVTQHERECNALRPDERARLAAHESRMETRGGRRFHGHHRDERGNQGRMGDTHRPDWGEQRYPRDSRPHDPGQGWRGQYRPGRPWSGDERRRDRQERSFDHRSRPGEQRDERRFKEPWNRDRWRR